jgi:hypothetical protein
LFDEGELVMMAGVVEEASEKHDDFVLDKDAEEEEPGEA